MTMVVSWRRYIGMSVRRFPEEGVNLGLFTVIEECVANMLVLEKEKIQSFVQIMI